MDSTLCSMDVGLVICMHGGVDPRVSRWRCEKEEEEKVSCDQFK